MTLTFENELGHIRTLTPKPRNRQLRVVPLQTGDTAPFFSLVGTPGNWQASLRSPEPPATAVSVLELIRDKPLVISFYCPCWGRYAEPFLHKLIRLHESLRAAGAELLVFSNESPRSLDRQNGPIAFPVAHDAAFSVARQFGVYSDDNPVWDRVSGISEDVFTPALYVLDGNRRITYHFLDDNFEGNLAPEAVLAAVSVWQPVGNINSLLSS